jgi:hypothetical protein
MNVKTHDIEGTAVSSDARRSHEKTIDQLRSFHRGEMSAVESYARALALASFAGVADVLRRCQASHQQRVGLLRERIRSLGGAVPTSSGPWGTMVTLLEDAAVSVSEKVGIGVLEEGEDHGLADYRVDLKELGPDEQRFVLLDLLPAQVETHRAMSNLKQAVTGGA